LPSLQYTQFSYVYVHTSAVPGDMEYLCLLCIEGAGFVLATHFWYATYSHFYMVFVCYPYISGNIITQCIPFYCCMMKYYHSTLV